MNTSSSYPPSWKVTTEGRAIGGAWYMSCLRGLIGLMLGICASTSTLSTSYKNRLSTSYRSIYIIIVGGNLL